MGKNKIRCKDILKFYTQNMDKELYIKILEEKLLKMIKYSNENWQLQLDIDPKHT